MAGAVELFRRMPEIVAADAALVRRGRFLDTEMLVGIGDADLRVMIAAGQPVLVEGNPLLRPWRFAVRADAPAWLAHWERMPKPGFHDLFALAKSGRARIEGDIHPLMANLQYIKDVLAAPRRLASEARLPGGA